MSEPAKMRRVKLTQVTGITLPTTVKASPSLGLPSAEVITPTNPIARGEHNSNARRPPGKKEMRSGESTVSVSQRGIAKVREKDEESNEASEERKESKKSSTEPEDFVCHTCGKMSTTHYKHYDHLRCHSARKFKCPFCARDFARVASLKSHKLRCHRELLSNYELKSIRNEVEKHLTCKICSRVFNARSSLRYHSQLHTGELRYSCDECGYKCFTRSALRRHEMTHDSTCVRCTNCHGLYKDMDDWKVHAERVHRDEDAEATANASAFSDNKNATMNNTRCLDEDQNSRIRLPDEGMDEKQEKNFDSMTTEVNSANSEHEHLEHLEESGLDSDADSEHLEELDINAGEFSFVAPDSIQTVPSSDSPNASASTTEIFTMFHCVPCTVVFIGKDELLDHYLTKHENLIREVHILPQPDHASSN